MSTVNFDQSFRATGGLQRFDCLAWVNFNGTGTVAIRASGNVSSITDNGTGDYTINFTNALPDANYAVIGGSNTSAIGAPGFLIDNATPQTTTSVRVGTFYTSATIRVDSSVVTAAIFR